MNRREMLKCLAALGLVTLIPGCGEKAAGPEGPEEPPGPDFPYEVDPEMLEARRTARRRTRRIIMNNDGNDARWNVNKPVTPELFLSKRTQGLVDSQVDAIFYCTGVTNVHHHAGRVGERQTNAGKGYVADELAKLGTDTLGVIADFCRRNGKEVFWSLRMNDTHDSDLEYDEISLFKRQHPELIVGKKGEKTPVLPGRWSAFDYGQEPVRRLIVAMLADVVTRYDIDGVELDFFRHPHYFRAQFYGNPVTQADCDKMTAMIREIRDLCDREGRRRGRPVLIAVRVPDSLGFAKAIGLDWEQWLREELIDLVTAADYLKFEPWTHLAAIGRQYDIPVYACIEQRRLLGGGDPENTSVEELWRTEAYKAWQAGVNGIYTFNRFDPYDPIFRELGDPALLAKLPRSGKESMTTLSSKGMLSPTYWLRNGNDFLKK